MLKKLTLVLLAICQVCCLCSCNVSDNTTEKDNLVIAQDNNESDSDLVSLESINGNNIEYAAPYSEGLMFLKLTSNDADVYCVDKNGKVVFKLNEELVKVRTSQFMNEYAFVTAIDTSGDYHTVLCDKKGKLTYPSDVGVTEFYGPDEILKAGYVLAVKEEANYASTKKQLGVLNTNLEWEIPLSEELYVQFADTLADSFGENFIVDNVFYSVKLSKSLNLKTGEVLSIDLKQVTPSSERSNYRGR